MFFSKLDAVNGILRVIGELRVNSLDDPHPALADIITALDDEVTKLNADQWWFNVEYPTLQPQVGNKQIIVPGDVLAVDTLDKSPRVAIRGGRLYNLDTSTREFDRPVKVRVHRRVAFDDLPYTARYYVAATAKLHFQSEMDGDGAETRKLQSDRAEAYTKMNAEHIRAVRANMLHRPGVQFHLWRMQGGSPFSIRPR